MREGGCLARGQTGLVGTRRHHAENVMTLTSDATLLVPNLQSDEVEQDTWGERLKSTVQLEHDRVLLVDEVSEALRAQATYEGVISMTREAVVPRLADLAVLVLDEPSGPRVDATHVQPRVTPLLQRAVTGSLDLLRHAVQMNTNGSRYARWIPAVNPTSAKFLTRGDPTLTRLLETFDVRSFIVVALRAGGRTLGALALGRCEDSDQFEGADFAAVQVLSRRIALALQAATLQEQVEPRSAVDQAIHRWTRVFDRAWWGAAVVDGIDRRIDTVNPAFARLHGFQDPSELTGHLFEELLPPERAAEPQQWQSAPDGQLYGSVHRRLDGTAVPVLVNVTPMDDGECPASYVVTVQDLTDLRRTEERLQRAQRMEAVGRLAGGVAHEVNNMMTIILGFSDLLTRELEQGHAARREVDEIRKAAMRAAKITTQLLAFSRQQVLQPVDLPLNEVVEEMVPVLRLMLPANVRVEMSLSPFPVVVKADRSQLEQVLINLAFNARDAMASGGTIRLVTEARHLAEADGRRLIGIPIPEGSYGLVSVVDTGHGMDEATLAQVFDPFFTTKPVGSGTGLGLSTVYGIVKQSGGYVWVESAPETGTTFTVCLPEEEAASAEVGKGPRRAQPRLKAAGHTVLILEDEDGVRELAARILEDRGYTVVQARNGGEAVAVLRDDATDLQLLLTDVVVPDMATEELEEQARKLRNGLPILYMSGYPRDEILFRGLLRKDHPFLQKPFTTDDLVAEVGRMVQRG
jgi:PAS domain S-box-containing protein